MKYTYKKILELLNDGKIEEAKKALFCNMSETKTPKKGQAAIIKKLDENTMEQYKGGFKTESGYYYTDTRRVFFSKMQLTNELNPDTGKSRIFEPFFELSGQPFTIDRDHVATTKRYLEKNKPYFLETPLGYVGFNPDFLLDAIDFSTENKFYIGKIKGNMYCLRSADAALLPIAVNDGAVKGVIVPEEYAHAKMPYILSAKNPKGV